MKPRLAMITGFAALVAALPTSALGPVQAEKLLHSLAGGGAELCLAQASRQEESGDLEAPLATLRRALEWAEVSRSALREGKAAYELGITLRNLARYEEALVLLERARGLFEGARAQPQLWGAEEALRSIQRELALPSSPTSEQRDEDLRRILRGQLFELDPTLQVPKTENDRDDLRFLLSVLDRFKHLIDEPQLESFTATIRLLIDPPENPEELQAQTEGLLANCDLSAELCLIVQMYTRFLRGRELAELGSSDEADREFTAAFELANRLGQPELVAASQTYRAIRLWDSGRREDALAQFEIGLRAIESLSAALTSDAVRTGYLETSPSNTLYHAYLKMLLASGEYLRAFELTERARSRALLSRFGTAPPRPAEPAARAEEEARWLAERAAARHALEAALPHERPEAEERLRRADREWEAFLVRRELGEGPPSQAEPSPLAIRTLLAELPADTALVSYFDSMLGLFVWVIDHQGFAFQPLVFEAADREQLERFLRALGERGARGRRGSQVPGEGFEDLTRISEQLYDRLISPIRPYLRRPRLIVLPHGDLHGLPFASLRNRASGRYLLEDFTITYAASASVAMELRKAETPVEGRALVLGAPLPEAQLADLPGAASEARRVAELLGTGPKLGAEATEAVLLDPAPLDVLHLAAHGFFSPESPATSHIALTPSGGQDGRLELSEIPERFRGRGLNLVVLSACETARGRRTAGDEILGLTRAFQMAGVPGVLSTLWPIDDPATAELMVALYRLWRGGSSLADALRTAQLERLRDPETADPSLWAAFRLTGDPVGRWP